MTNLTSCLEKQRRLKEQFSLCTSSQQKYEKIIEMGRQLPAYPIELKTSEYSVKGCQSTMYLATSLEGGKIQFQAYSEALISAGLAALLIAIYQDESPEVILTCPPSVLEELSIHGSLSPGRSNGLASLFQRMKQDALKFLVNI
jgi:cysteine desulfuration protein SufE